MPAESPATARLLYNLKHSLNKDLVLLLCMHEVYETIFCGACIGWSTIYFWMQTCVYIFIILAVFGEVLANKIKFMYLTPIWKTSSNATVPGSKTLPEWRKLLSYSCDMLTKISSTIAAKIPPPPWNFCSCCGCSKSTLWSDCSPFPALSAACPMFKGKILTLNQSIQIDRRLKTSISSHNIK